MTKESYNSSGNKELVQPQQPENNFLKVEDKGLVQFEEGYEHLNQDFRLFVAGGGGILS